MNVTAYKTPIVTPGTDLYKLLDASLPTVSEGSVVAVTSKIVSICEGRLVPEKGTNKDELIRKEATKVIPRTKSKYDSYITITRGHLAAAAGIDASNTNGNYVLWPSDTQKSANDIREFLGKRDKVKHIGVIITDSKTTPLVWGVTGTALAHSGFEALNDIIGKPDLFGREMKLTKVNIAEALAASAVLVMGERNEQTPLAVLTDLPFVKFQNRNPTQDELDALVIDPDDDLYEPLLSSAPWE